MLKTDFLKAGKNIVAGAAIAAVSFMPFNAWAGNTAPANDAKPAAAEQLPEWRRVHKFVPTEKHPDVLALAMDVSEDQPLFLVRASKEHLRRYVGAAFDAQGKMYEQYGRQVIVVYELVEGENVGVIYPFAGGFVDISAFSPNQKSGVLHPSELDKALPGFAKTCQKSLGDPKAPVLLTLSMN